MAEKPGPYGSGREQPDGLEITGGKMHGGQRAWLIASNWHGTDDGGLCGLLWPGGLRSIKRKRWMSPIRDSSSRC
jgi:hypothetical protein